MEEDEDVVQQQQQPQRSALRAQMRVESNTMINNNDQLHKPRTRAKTRAHRRVVSAMPNIQNLPREFDIGNLNGLDKNNARARTQARMLQRGRGDRNGNINETKKKQKMQKLNGIYDAQQNEISH